MAPSDEPDDLAEIRTLIWKINDAWLNHPSDSIAGILSTCLAEDVVFRGPGFVEVGRGRAACIAGYEEFARTASIHECTLSEPEIDRSGDCAVASYSWRMRFEMEGAQYDESGLDIFFVSRNYGRWEAVWRAVLPQSAA